MPRGTKIMLSFADWPAEDQERWNQAFKPTDRFEESQFRRAPCPGDAKKPARKLWAFPGIPFRLLSRSPCASARHPH